MTTQEIFYCKGQGVKIPVHFDPIKYGGGICLTIVNRTENFHLVFVANASAMIAELRRVIDEIEQAVATNEQIFIGRAGNGTPAPVSPPPAPQPTPPAEPARRPVLADLNGDPRHDWPIYVKRFKGGDAPEVLPAIAHLYKTRFQYSAPDIEAIIEADERLHLDFEMVRPYLPKILDADGALRTGARSRVAEALGIKDAGNYRARIDAVLEFILENSVELLEEMRRSLDSNRQKQAIPNEISQKNEPVKKQKQQRLAS